MSEENKYWFPAKRYGWGWGWPTAWQGKLVVAVFYVAVLAGAFVLLPGQSTTPFVIYVALLSVFWSGCAGSRESRRAGGRVRNRKRKAGHYSAQRFPLSYYLQASVFIALLSFLQACRY